MGKRHTWRSDIFFCESVCLFVFVCLPVCLLGTGWVGWKIFSNIWLFISIVPGRIQCFSIHLFIHQPNIYLACVFCQELFGGAGSTTMDTTDWPFLQRGPQNVHRMNLSFGQGMSGHLTWGGVCAPVQMDSFSSSPGFTTASPWPGPMPVQWELAGRTRFEERKATRADPKESGSCPRFRVSFG